MKRKLSLLLALVMILSLVPMSVFAATGGSLTATAVPVISKGSAAQNYGSVRMVIPMGSQTKDHKLTVSISTGELPTVGTVANAGDNVEVIVPGNFGSNPNGITAGAIKAVEKTGKKTFTVEFQNDVDFSYDAVLLFKLNQINVSDAKTGAVEAKFEASPNSGIPTGVVTVASIGSSDSVKLTVSDVETDSSDFKFNLNILEEKPGSISATPGSEDTITLKLPAGYAWKDYDPTTELEVTTKFGDGAKYKLDRTNDDVRELKVTFTTGTTRFSSFSIKDLEFSVADEFKVKDGDINAAVKASGFSIDVSSLLVGKKADYGVTIKADEEVAKVEAGKEKQEIENIVIEEKIAGSLIKGRTILIKLPEQARWVASDHSVKEDDKSDYTVNHDVDNNRILRVKVEDGKDLGKVATVTLKGLEIVVEPGYVGKIEAEVSGTQGLTGKLVLAEVVKPVKMTAEKVADVIVGKDYQPASTFTIEEANKEAFRTGTVNLILPAGVEWARVPKVEVEDGDVSIGSVSLNSDGDIASFRINSDSINVSKIKVSNVELKVLRYVPEGDIKVSVGGGAVVDTAAVTPYWPNSNKADEVAIAKVTTPAEGEFSAEPVAFTIDKTTYKVGEVEKVMDVAPYIKDSRTFLSVRYAAEALGVNPNAIIWNQEAQTVTILKNGSIAQITVGSKVLKVNGSEVLMDTAAENVNGRVTLPIAHLAMALGVNYTWDDATRTVTFK